MTEEHIEKHLNRPDRHFEFHDKVTYIEKQEVTVQSGAEFHNGPAPDKDGKSRVVIESTKTENSFAESIKGIFFGKYDVAQAFINDISGLKDSLVTNVVNRYVQENKISTLSCHRDLWKVLHENGYYEASESNWNKAIRY